MDFKRLGSLNFLTAEPAESAEEKEKGSFTSRQTIPRETWANHEDTEKFGTTKIGSMGTHPHLAQKGLALWQDLFDVNLSFPLRSLRALR